jgi:hypothetical protein
MTLSTSDLIALVEAAIEEREMGAVECGHCGFSSDDHGSEAVIEHARFDHINGAPLIIVERTELISTYEMQLLTGGEPRTEHERKWREQRALAMVEDRIRRG